MTAPPLIFDRVALRQRKNRAAENFADYDFLFQEVGERLTDRIADTPREFKMVWNVGAHPISMIPALQNSTCFNSHCAALMLVSSKGINIAADEEMLPIKSASMDLIFSNLALHWVNDLPGCLSQICKALQPDGLFLASMIGGNSLFELRKCLLDAEIEISGGVSPRVSPMADVRDMGSLLQRAGFTMPVADLDTIEVQYSDPFKLMKDLRGMGETNILMERSKKPISRAIAARAAELYFERFPHPNGGIRATFQIIYLTGWAPSPDQPKALKPGSAKVSLASVLSDSTNNRKA